MERFISACRNLLAKSATTKAIGYATQVPNASAKVLLFLPHFPVFPIPESSVP